LRCGRPHDERILRLAPGRRLPSAALIRCSEVWWVDSSRDHPGGARLPSFSTRSAAVNSIARPWSAANWSAACSDRRLIAALASGTSTAVSSAASVVLGGNHHALHRAPWLHTERRGGVRESRGALCATRRRHATASGYARQTAGPPHTVSLTTATAIRRRGGPLPAAGGSGAGTGASSRATPRTPRRPSRPSRPPQRR
jgi:hypothetical protein